MMYVMKHINFQGLMEIIILLVILDGFLIQNILYSQGLNYKKKHFEN